MKTGEIFATLYQRYVPVFKITKLEMTKCPPTGQCINCVIFSHRILHSHENLMTYFYTQY
jgi:hypothetical protein